MYCLKPKLKSIPSGDWYCNECKPKMRVRSPKKKTRQVFAEVDDDENEDDDNSDEKDDSEDSDDGASDNEDATASFKTGKAGNSDDHQVGGEEDDSDEDHEVVLAISNGLKRSCNDAQSAVSCMFAKIVKVLGKLPLGPKTVSFCAALLELPSMTPLQF